ncbi:DUF429 domain-containing protein [Rhizobium phaseoli]|uniref:DUF429 domain-containing protein n=1 Tax=Rhizobium phaseoli TaxID=396 RepID=UPI0007F0E278|nr:DUF429 domain-containing protein [Rhizobium phaseoli]ANL39280.1 hypothetical protein AMC88_CH00849 [Rhizobium phaseoli]ANL58269.1 hypothetical protein AMC85_CH00849 [Rhizobium phaseoli]
MSVAVVAHCDWSMEQKKRWMAVAIKRGGQWHFQSPELVGDTSRLLDRLQHRAVNPGALLIGFDFPIGLPEAYARAAGVGSFREALISFGSGFWSDWYNVADHRDHISLQRPFYPARPGGTARHLLDALGISDASSLLRICERATADRQAACMLFWTLGGNQVGKGAISGWREIIVPRLNEIGLWPFDGNLAELAGSKPIIITETYPGDVYRQIGMPRNGWSKRRRQTGYGWDRVYCLGLQRGRTSIPVCFSRLSTMASALTKQARIVSMPSSDCWACSMSLTASGVKAFRQSMPSINGRAGSWGTIVMM